MVLLLVFGILNVYTDVDACDCIRDLYEHRERKILCYTWDSNPRLAFQLDALPIELFLAPQNLITD